jgi:type IV pilus assembly protein PilV
LRCSQNGFTFFEILIALLIVAVGILGHASMQMKSTDIAQRAGYAQTANLGLLDLAQRIRANSMAAIGGEFDHNNLVSGTLLTVSKDCATSLCNRADFASYELQKWFIDLDMQLPIPRFSVITVGNLVTISLVWDAGRSGSGYATCLATNTECQTARLTVWLR